MEAVVEQLRQQIADLSARLQAAETAQAAATPTPGATTNGGPGGPPRADILDTRVLGKPEHFSGDQKSWRDWAIVMRSYAGLVDNQLSTLMRNAETSIVPVLNATLEDPQERSSFRLYHILLMLCKGQALDRLMTAGEGEGLEGWRLLVDK